MSTSNVHSGVECSRYIVWSRSGLSDCGSRDSGSNPGGGQADEVLGNGLFYGLSHPHRTQVYSECLAHRH